MSGLILLGAGVGLLAPAPGAADRITSTEVYHLAHTIDEALIDRHDLYTTFDHPQLTDAARPLHVYQRALAVVEEFNHLHRGVFGTRPIAEARLIALRERPRHDIEPRDVHAVLQLVADALAADGPLPPLPPPGTPRSPSDVYQMLRQISHHHRELANRATTLPWNKPLRVFELNWEETYPLLRKMCETRRLAAATFVFPEEPANGVRPRDVFAAQLRLHRVLTDHYQALVPTYEPVQLRPPPAGRDVLPADVFDVSQIVVGELRQFAGHPPALPRAEQSRYYDWKARRHGILPSDVLRLIEHTTELARTLRDQAHVSSR